MTLYYIDLGLELNFSCCLNYGRFYLINPFSNGICPDFKGSKELLPVLHSHNMEMHFHETLCFLLKCSLESTNAHYFPY